MKFILHLLIIMMILGCSNKNENIEENIIESVNLLTITNSSSVSNTPFSKPAEAIIYEDNLYSISDLNTYKYNFESNIWETINTNNLNVANTKDSNVSFIKDSKWYIINRKGLWTFDFSANKWEILKEFTDNLLLASSGVYHNDSLYIFSNIYDNVYKYNFENNSLILHSTFTQKPVYGILTKTILKIKGSYYYLRLTNGGKMAIYKWIDDFTNFELLNEFKYEDWLTGGSAFVFNDNIVFGLGGDIVTGVHGGIASFSLNDKFYYYDIINNESKKIENSFYTGTFNALPIEYNNKFYLLGGTTILNREIIYRNTLDQIEFKFIEY
ncbi:hypothetical protein [Maribacter sp. R86514]|uniref:hypothetical protein n=1 Tax=Maribacter sp. R86514 TaxID=3093854 RepID=UPI0037CCAF97